MKVKTMYNPMIPHPTTLDNYSNVISHNASVYSIHRVEEAQQLFQSAQREGRRVVFRGGGNSLHDQAQGREWVAQLRLPKVVYPLKPHSFRATTTATWPDVWRCSQPLDMVPGVVPNTEWATLGGTLSANCLCQFSPILGKESNGVESFVLLTPDGEKQEVLRPGPGTSAEQDALFYGVVGGLGSLGLVTEVQHRLLSFPFDGPANVQTTVNHAPSTEHLIRQLIDAHHANHKEHRDKREPWFGYKTLPKPSPLGVLHNDGYGCLIEKEYVPSTSKRSPFIFHTPKTIQNIMGNMVVMAPGVGNLFWKKLHNDWKRRTQPYIDRIPDTLFSMEGNRTARQLLGRVGLETICPQQTFVLPIDHKENPYRASLQFMDSVFEALHNTRFSPSLIDMLTLPKDSIALSATRDMDGLAITLSFQEFGKAKLPALIKMLQELSQDCAAVGGRVHLVKNVFVEPDVLEEMYIEGLQEWKQLKDQLDPNRILVSQLFQRMFSSYVQKNQYAEY
ncbi:MAG: FAD-binding protein [Deltaproteobacteria bacterium]|nr:MAG: FAD-binding protein [Deltaproteobacteria bacterium]